RQDLARFEFARRRSLDQVLGDLADTLLELRLLRLPGAAAQTVKLGALFVGPVARQELDILDGEEQTVVARIHDEEAVMRCWLQDLARFEFARRRSLDQVLGDLADTLLELRLLRLPGAAAQTVKLGALFVGPVARQELDILDGEEQTVVARIHDEEAVMRCCLHLDGTETLEAAEPMIDMDDEIAGCER